MVQRKTRDDRDGGQFLALPHVVLTSPGWLQASHTARSLLIDIASRYTGANNGRLVATLDSMSAKGWRSPAVLSQALRELIACGLLVETRKGAFPNKAAWYALAWQGLNQTDDLDINPKQYNSVHRRSYMNPQPYERPKRKAKGPTGLLRVA